MVKDLKMGACFRADHLVEGWYAEHFFTAVTSLVVMVTDNCRTQSDGWIDLVTRLPQELSEVDYHTLPIDWFTYQCIK